MKSRKYSLCVVYTFFTELLGLVYSFYRYFMGSDPNVRSGMFHQIEETVNSNLNFNMLIRTTFMIVLENFKDVFIHFIRTS